MKNTELKIKEAFIKNLSIKAILEYVPDLTEEDIRKQFNNLAKEEIESVLPSNLSIITLYNNKYFQYIIGERTIFIGPDGTIYFSLSELKAEEEINENRVNILSCIADAFKKNVMEEIEILLRKYISLNYEEYYSVLSAYSILTNVFDSFNSIPYLKLKGNKGTGKTTILTVLKNIVNNPFFVSNITTASLIRLTDKLATTILIDEAESLEKRSLSNTTIFEILNSGYQKDGKATRVDSNGGLIEYNTYGPKIIAGINDLAPATEDRCIIIETKQNNLKNVPFIASKEQLKELEELKLNLFYATPSLQRSIINEDFSQFPELKNRAREKWLPLLLIAKCLNYGVENILKASKRDIKQKEEQEKSTPENMALETLASYVNSNEKEALNQSSEYICFEAAPLSNAIKEADVYRRFTNQGHVTSFLKTKGILTGRIRVKNTPTTIYRIPLHLIKKEEV
ncbi:MAG: hypothetical protein ACM3O3_01640 [Syntrophothermus sp.]